MEGTIVEKRIIDEKVVNDYLFWSETKLTDEQKKLFIWMAISCQLDPFKREIYAIPYEKNVKQPDWSWKKEISMSVVTGYQVYIERATSTWLLDGREVTIDRWVSEIDWKEKILWASITIYRKDFSHPFKWSVSIREFAKMSREWKPMGSWATMPEFMIKKVVIGQWFRFAFPNEMWWLPYLSEEITDKDENNNKEKEEKEKEEDKNKNILEDIDSLFTK